MFSIITVTYNSEKTLKDTIESVYKQKFHDYEYLIIDGKSSDRTLEIAKSYEEKFHGKLRIFSEADHGIYDAMNKGINYSKGKYIGIINSDDWYDENALQKAYDSFSESHALIVTGEMNLYTVDKNFIKNCPNQLLAVNILKKMPVNHPATFVAKDVYKQIGTFNIKYKLSADYDLICRACKNGIQIYQIPSVLANMRMGGATSPHGKRKEDLAPFFVTIKENHQIRKENFLFDSEIKYRLSLWFLYLRKLKRIILN